MTIKAIKERLNSMDKIQGLSGKKSFEIRNFNEFGKCVVCMINDRYLLKYVVACVQVSTGIDLFYGSHSRPCDNLTDAGDVAGEILSDNYADIINHINGGV